MNKKNMIFVLLLACVPAHAVVNEQESSKWKYGTYVAGAVSLLSVGACVYNVLKMNKIEQILREGGLSEEEAFVRINKLKSHKNWAWGTGVLGLFSLAGTGFCIYKRRSKSCQEQERPQRPGLQRPQPQQNNDFRIPIVPQTIGDIENGLLSEEQRKLAQILAYANLAFNERINPNFNAITQHIRGNAMPERRRGWWGQVFCEQFDNLFLPSLYEQRDIEQHHGVERGQQMVDDRTRLANGRLQQAAVFLNNYRQNPEAALRENAGDFFDQNTTVEQRARLVHGARELNNLGHWPIPARMQDL